MTVSVPWIFANAYPYELMVFHTFTFYLYYVHHTL